MDDFIQAIVNLFPSPLRGPVQAIANRILAIWHGVTDFWGRVRGGWQRLRNAAWGRALAQLRHAYALAVTLRWLVTVYVPRITSIGFNAVLGEARQLVGLAVAGARLELATVRDWLAAGLADARSLLAQWATWTRDRISELLAGIQRVNDRLFGTLGTPERIAAWIVGAMATALIGWAEDNAIRLGRRLVATRARIALSSLGWAEDLISRIL